MSGDQIKIILFNGPPGCGKDTAARGLYEDTDIEAEYATQFVRFSSPLKSALASFFSKPIDDFGVSSMEAQKDSNALPGGVSYRTAQIKLSEEYAKPLFGEGIFGKLLVDRVYKAYAHASRNGLLGENGKMLTFVPDSGFMEEFIPVVDEFGPANIMLVKIYREGKDFSADSRGYLDPVHYPVRIERLFNDASPEAFIKDVKQRITKWLSIRRAN